MTDKLSIAVHAFACRVFMSFNRKWDAASEVGEFVD